MCFSLLVLPSGQQLQHDWCLGELLLITTRDHLTSGVFTAVRYPRAQSDEMQSLVPGTQNVGLEPSRPLPQLHLGLGARGQASRGYMVMGFQAQPLPLDVRTASSNA